MAGMPPWSIVVLVYMHSQFFLQTHVCNLFHGVNAPPFCHHG